MNPEVQEFSVGQVQHIYTKYAELEYYHDPETGFWELQQLDSDKPGEGKKLIRAFVNKIGPGQPIKLMAILEKETRRRLSQLGVFKFVHENQQTVNISTEATLKTLKIVRVHRGGGIRIDKVTVVPSDPSEEEIESLAKSSYSIDDPDSPYAEIYATGST